MEQLPQVLVDYLKEKGIDSCQEGDLARVVIGMMEEKDQTISNLSQQITKYKCQDIKNQKLIKTLQDKLSQLAPSISDTGSYFMMASQFKVNFEELITTAVPSALADLVDRPFLFSKCLSDLITHTQHDLSAKLSQIVTVVYDTLHINLDICHQQAVKSKIRLSLLKIFQQFWESMLPFEPSAQLKYQSIPQQKQLAEELNEIVSSDDYVELRKQLHKIVVYMLLQEKEWEFVNVNSGSTIKYSKRQHTCLDGWVKQGQDALLVLEGLRRDSHLHANLKNYVIPIVEGDSPQLYSSLALKPAARAQEADGAGIVAKISERMFVPATKMEGLAEIVNTIPNSEEETSLLIKNKSEEVFKQHRSFKQKKENSLNYANKKPKKKEKQGKPSLESSLKAERSPKSRRKNEDSVRTKKLESEEHLDCIEEKIQILKQQIFSKKKNSTAVINKNISNSHDIMFQDLSMLPLKRRPLEELPVSKELPLRKKTKPATSRKNSVGKIVSQHHIIGQKQAKEKENCQNYMNGKAKAKEKVYKDIIKEKLIEEKGAQKAQLSLSLLHPKAKTDRQRRKEENRPLKIQGNANKLRQKYMS